jgi:hypothetical protein
VHVSAPSDWPATRWSDLSAADVVALLWAPQRPLGVEVAMRVLTELVGRRVLREVAVRRSGAIAPRGDVLAFVAGGAAPPATGLAADAWAVYRSGPATTFADGTRGVEARHVATGLARRHGGWDGLARAAGDGLARRRLATVPPVRRTRLGRRVAVDLTPAGEDAARELHRWIRTAWDLFEDRTGRDPVEAFAMAGGYGVSALVMDMVMRDLRTALRALDAPH